MKKGQAVLVTTEFRGVFYGRVKDASKLPEKLTLTDVRNCIRWTNDCGGFLGLAASGPTKSCRIGKCVDEFTMYKITGHAPVSDKAVKQWEKYK